MLEIVASFGYYTVTLTESVGSGGHLLFASIWFRHSGDAPYTTGFAPPSNINVFDTVASKSLQF